MKFVFTTVAASLFALVAFMDPLSRGALTARASPVTQMPCASGLIVWDEARNCIGWQLWVTGTVVRHFNARPPTFLDLGLPYPDPGRFNVVIWPQDLWKFQPPPSQYPGRNACVYGVITTFRGVPQIVPREGWQLKICE
jgi:hypothetical protein